MSVEIALNRAAYRHLCNLLSIASMHYIRSGRIAYYHRALRLADRANVVELTCNFR